jgi:transposase
MVQQYPVVGIDVAKNFCFYAVLSPKGEVFMKTFKAFNDKEGFDFVIRQLKKVEDAFNSKPAIVLESTGHYSQRIVHFFCNRGFKVFLVNPLVSHSIKSSLIRKVKTDKVDAEELARLLFLRPLQEFVRQEDYYLSLKTLSRAAVLLSEQRVTMVNQLTAAVEQVMPTYTQIFSNIASDTSLEVLTRYSSPHALQQASETEFINLIRTFSRRGLKYSQTRYELLLKCAEESKSIGILIEGLYEIIRIYAANLKHINEQIKQLEAKINSLSIHIPAIKLLATIPGIGKKLAHIIASEIGDINRFRNAKQLIAYCGIDPSVRQSGNFNGTKNRITKRGSPFIRKALYIAATIVIRQGIKGTLVNPVLHTYYQHKIQTKAKKQALGAVMNKMVRIIYSVLKNSNPFELITPEEQEKRYRTTLKIAA